MKDITIEMDMENYRYEQLIQKLRTDKKISLKDVFENYTSYRIITPDGIFRVQNQRR